MSDGAVFDDVVLVMVCKWCFVDGVVLMMLSRWCEEVAEEEEGRKEAEAGWSQKNKTPTRQCGEETGQLATNKRMN